MIKKFLILILILVFHGCAGQVPVIKPPEVGISLPDICTKYNVTWQWDGVTQVVILEYRGNKAKALVGSNTVLVGKEKIILSAPLRRVNSTIYVPEDFEAKVINPFGSGQGMPGERSTGVNLRVQSVIIDAGHGGKDPGAQGPSGLKEKEVVLDISRRLKTILEAAGIKVIMTRSTDEFITLPHRTEMASRSDADLFVSIHANSNPARKIEGMEVYYVKTKNKRDLEEEQRQKNEKIFIHRLKMNYSSTLGGIIEDMMYNLKTAESLKLADMISKQSSSFVDTPNRGARTCRFFVVRNTLMPAVLVEVGFLTNRREEKKLSLGSYRQKLADSIAHCIIKYASES